jgi:DNA-binding transcriptional LysR family regulator
VQITYAVQHQLGIDSCVVGINIGIAHLRAVVALADLQSFTSAAAALGVSQPNLSRTVAEAERRLGVRLFVRTTRSVDPTGDGLEVAAYGRRILLEFDDGLEQIARFVSGERGTVTIACLPSIAAIFLPPYIVEFRRNHPDVSVHVKDGLRDGVVASVRDGSVDFAVVAASGRANDQHRRIRLRPAHQSPSCATNFVVVDRPGRRVVHLVRPRIQHRVTCTECAGKRGSRRRAIGSGTQRSCGGRPHRSGTGRHRHPGTGGTDDVVRKPGLPADRADDPQDHLRSPIARTTPKCKLFGVSQRSGAAPDGMNGPFSTSERVKVTLIRRGRAIPTKGRTVDRGRLTATGARELLHLNE